MSESMSELERDIEASRARLDEKIEQIQGRLSPSSLVDEMLGSARRTPALGGGYESALETVRRNPVPVLLIVAGVGLLLSRMGRGKGYGAARTRGAIVPVAATGADRTYDPDQPAGRPPRVPVGMPAGGAAGDGPDRTRI